MKGRGRCLLSCGDVEPNPSPKGAGKAGTMHTNGRAEPDGHPTDLEIDVVVDVDEDLWDAMWGNAHPRAPARPPGDDAMQMCLELAEAGMDLDDVNELAMVFHPEQPRGGGA